MNNLMPYEGQMVVIQGWGFTVCHPRIVQHGEQSFVRFEGKALDIELIGTGYDGGTYGHVVGHRYY